MTAINATTKQYDSGGGVGKAARANGMVGFVETTIGAEAANAILVTFQLKKLNAHDNMDRPVIGTIYQYEDTSGTIDTELNALGSVLHNLSVTTGVMQSAFHDGLEIAVRSTEAGVIAVTLTDSGAASTATKYLGLKIGDFFVQTAAITFA